MKIHQLKIDFNVTEQISRFVYIYILNYSLEKAAAMGFGAVLFEGSIGFYGKSGFTYARNFGIRYHDLPEGGTTPSFSVRN